MAMAVVMTMTGALKLLAIFHLDSSANMSLVFLTMLFALLPQLELFTDKFSLSLDSIGITNPTKRSQEFQTNLIKLGADGKFMPRFVIRETL